MAAGLDATHPIPGRTIKTFKVFKMLIVKWPTS